VVGGVNTTAVRTGVSAGDVAAATLGSSVTVRAEAPGLTADSVTFRMIPDESGELWL
jgi:predicted thioesterase